MSSINTIVPQNTYVFGYEESNHKENIIAFQKLKNLDLDEAILKTQSPTSLIEISKVNHAFRKAVIRTMLQLKKNADNDHEISSIKKLWPGNKIIPFEKLKSVYLPIEILTTQSLASIFKMSKVNRAFKRAAIKTIEQLNKNAPDVYYADDAVKNYCKFITKLGEIFNRNPFEIEIQYRLLKWPKNLISLIRFNEIKCSPENANLIQGIKNCSLLYKYTTEGNLRGVKWLLKYKATPDFYDPHHYHTALHRAINQSYICRDLKKGDQEKIFRQLIQILLKAHADPNIPAYHPRSPIITYPLYQIVSRNDHVLFKLFMQHNAHLHEDQRVPPASSYREKLSTILIKEAKWNLCVYAVQYGKLDLDKHLRSYPDLHMRVDSSGNTLLHTACWMGSSEVVRWYAQKMGVTSMRNAKNEIPVERAFNSYKNNRHVATPHLGKEDEKSKYELEKIKDSDENLKKVMELLIEQGANLEEMFSNGSTLLQSILTNEDTGQLLSLIVPENQAKE